MSTHPILFTLVKVSPENEVRHLLIHREGGPSTTSLSLLIYGVEIPIATGTQYEMGQEAEMLMRAWRDEGFKVPDETVLVFESLKHTVALAAAMGYSLVQDPSCMSTFPQGLVPLTEWSGKSHIIGGGYQYAFCQYASMATILGCPTLPPKFGLNVTSANEEFEAEMKRVLELKGQIGRIDDFILRRGDWSF